MRRSHCRPCYMSESTKGTKCSTGSAHWKTALDERSRLSRASLGATEFCRFLRSFSLTEVNGLASVTHVYHI